MNRTAASAGLLLATIILWAAALPPVGQFYLAWIALGPWLIVVGRCESGKSAFWGGWLAGTLFFSANMWWLIDVSAYGWVALMIYLGFWWGVAAYVIRGAGLLDEKHGRGWIRGIAAVILVPAVWVATEWLARNSHHRLALAVSGSFANTVAGDVPGGRYAGGVWGFVLGDDGEHAGGVGGVGRMAVVDPAGDGGVRRGGGGSGGIRGVSDWQTPACLGPGVKAMVVQTNFPQSNSGAKGAGAEELLDANFDLTVENLKGRQAGDIGLVVWSETMMPPLNDESCAAWAAAPIDHPAVNERAYDLLRKLCGATRIYLLTGGMYGDQWHWWGDRFTEGEKRNSAYLFDPDGRMDEKRYDKIHLVPFGEFIPFKESIPWLYDFFLKLGPADMSQYELQAGSSDALTVFEMTEPASGRRLRFVTPICFEDIHAPLIAKMFNGDDGRKRADILVNITNDGWFKGPEHSQHFQAATFRTIENRVYMARSVNTGISGFVDSLGRSYETLPAQTRGASVGEMRVDSRVTFYTQHGDLFAACCAAISGVLAVVALAAPWLEQKERK